MNEMILTAERGDTIMRRILSVLIENDQAHYLE